MRTIATLLVLVVMTAALAACNSCCPRDPCAPCDPCDRPAVCEYASPCRLGCDDATWPDYPSTNYPNARQYLNQIIANATLWQSNGSCNSICKAGWAQVASEANDCLNNVNGHSWNDPMSHHARKTCNEMLASVLNARNLSTNMGSYAACMSELNHEDGGKFSR